MCNTNASTLLGAQEVWIIMESVDHLFISATGIGKNERKEVRKANFENSLPYLSSVISLMCLKV